MVCLVRSTYCREPEDETMTNLLVWNLKYRARKVKWCLYKTGKEPRIGAKSAKTLCGDTVVPNVRSSGDVPTCTGCKAAQKRQKQGGRRGRRS